jgi:tRNA nucleotidyltransferase (CCA-adding enzyme)
MIVEQQKLASFFGPELLGVIKSIGQFAEEQNAGRLFLVGGTVRDLFLERRIDLVDVDFALEGEAIAFSESLITNWDQLNIGLELSGKKQFFKKYGTSKIYFKEGSILNTECIDFASTRIETYPIPGSKPVVTFGKLEEDLNRRDFSINALALSIAPESFGELVDLNSGYQDLQNKVLRILHSRSFIDDPARLIRLVRFRARLDFSVEKQTEQAFFSAVRNCLVATLPKERLADEYRKAQTDSASKEILKKLGEVGLLKQIMELLD